MRTRGKASARSAIDMGRRKRVTVTLPENLDKNAEMYATFSGVLKTTLVTEALRQYLQSHGLGDPLSPPANAWNLSTKPRSARINQAEHEAVPA